MWQKGERGNDIDGAGAMIQKGLEHLMKPTMTGDTKGDTKFPKAESQPPNGEDDRDAGAHTDGANAGAGGNGSFKTHASCKVRGCERLATLWSSPASCVCS